MRPPHEGPVSPLRGQLHRERQFSVTYGSLAPTPARQQHPAANTAGGGSSQGRHGKRNARDSNRKNKPCDSADLGKINQRCPPFPASHPDYGSVTDANTQLAIAAKSDPKAMDRLLRANRGLVCRIASKYQGRGMSRRDEDLVQLGMIGLWRAVETFDPGKGSFSKHAGMAIRREITHRSVDKHTRRLSKGGVQASAARPDSLDQMGHNILPGWQAPHRDYAWDDDTIADLGKYKGETWRAKEQVERAIADADLTDVERETLRQRLEGKTQQEIGAAQGRSRRRVGENEDRAIRKVQHAVNLRRAQVKFPK